ARGLREIIEDLLSKLMFDSPSDPTIERIVISRGCVEKTEEPQILHRGEVAALPEKADKELAEGKNPA
ncbi:MAG: ATP-dependent Clp protease ATP-binding subunit ClpX, partial [Oscillospiraceae bacterium]|nr:ATP-dependent Clp protease ATP-binding subunit ClpX [Oscillospiraceae bacterium]MBP1557387.1 ATP-dependent Clp protease ATP-binding subunit ClpX [Oscillospiraceae bacterium]